MAPADTLTEPQLQALFDILSHNTVYAEIEDFRQPHTLKGYGPPFGSKSDKPSNTPSLQSLVSKFIITLPGLKNVSSDFWNNQVGAVIEAFEDAELSESYDKGSLGIRKTLATAISALIEYPVRGIFGGFDPPPSSVEANNQYDTRKAADLERAFKDIMIQATYSDALDKVFKKTAETDKLSEHTAEVQAAHEYVIVNLASFMHYTLIKSPKGQQLLTLIDHANKLIPYTMIRQTLKIGNVASMISAMVKVVLAKMSVASVTNWIGFTQGGDEGMNLLQSIVSALLSREVRDLSSRAQKIEKSKDAPGKQQLAAVKAYLEKSRAEHEALRERSLKNKESLVHVILSNNGTSTQCTETQHVLLLEYLSLHLSIRDRTELIRILCHSQPDNLTASIRSLVTAYEPLIRSVHNAVDLSETLYDFEVFLRDMIKLAKLPAESEKKRAPTPTVGDFVQLLKKHMYSSHKFLHSVAKNGTEITKWFYDYAKHAASQFQRHVDKETLGGAGDLSPSLRDLWKTLDEKKKRELVQVLDAHSSYLNKLHAASSARLHTVVTSPTTNHPVLKNAGSAPGSRSSSPAPSRLRSKKSEPKIQEKGRDAGEMAGPGAYLARWQHLLDSTLITPAEATGGRVRGGGLRSVIKASETTVEGTHEPPADATNGDTTNDQSGEQKKGEKDPADRAAEAMSDVGSDDDVFEDASERLDALGLGGDGRKKQDDLRVDTGPVVDALGRKFRDLLAERSRDW